MRQKKVKPLKTKLLKRLRGEAYGKFGVFKFSDGKYRVVYDKTFWNDVTEFNEKHWRAYGDEYQYQVFNRDVEVCDTLERAKIVCDYYRRQYILREVRRIRQGNHRRFY